MYIFLLLMRLLYGKLENLMLRNLCCSSMSECAQVGLLPCAYVREYALPETVNKTTNAEWTSSGCHQSTSDEGDQARGERVSPPREQANALHHWQDTLFQINQTHSSLNRISFTLS